jgi:hypothetical protein
MVVLKYQLMRHRSTLRKSCDVYDKVWAEACHRALVTVVAIHLHCGNSNDSTQAEKLD